MRLIDAGASKSMHDLISRQEAIKAVGSMLRRKFGIGGDLAEITLAGLPSAQPTVDAVPVVRCKHCKYWEKSRINYNEYVCYWGGYVKREDDFCSWAKRKE